MRTLLHAGMCAPLSLDLFVRFLAIPLPILYSWAMRAHVVLTVARRLKRMDAHSTAIMQAATASSLPLAGPC